MEHGNKPFVKDAKTYGLDRPIPEVIIWKLIKKMFYFSSFLLQRRKHKELNLNSFKHEDPFKPSNPPKKVINMKYKLK